MAQEAKMEEFKLPLVEFSVGQVQDGAEFSFVMHKSRDLTDLKRKLVCNADNMQYVGSNFAYDPSQGHLKQYLIVVDKKSGKKRIFPTENYKLYPNVKREEDIDSDVERQQSIEKVMNETRTFTERLDHLTEVFGSKIKKKSMATRQRNKVSDTTEVVKAAVQSMVEEEGIAGGTNEEQNLSILPYDKDATSEDQVYALEAFIPTNIRSAASEAAQELIGPSAEKIKLWKEAKNPLGSRYIAWRACHLHPSVSNDPDILQEYINCLQILAYFMKVYAPTGNLQEKNEYLSSMSEPVKDWISHEFMPDSKRITLKARLPSQVKDKILAYAVILAWHIDSCQFDVQMLAEGFGISEKKLSTVVRALGGKTKIAMQEGMKRTIGILQLPLTFPKEGRRKGR